MDKINNDEFGLDSTLSPEIVGLLMEINKISNLEVTPQQKTIYLDEHEQALVC